MERKRLAKRGRALYRIRGRTVGPVFGQVKGARGIDRFMRRGEAACDPEWKLVHATHNLLKLWRSGRLKRELADERKGKSTGNDLSERREGKEFTATCLRAHFAE